MGKAYRLGLVKQDDGGMPIVEYIVKYKTVSTLPVVLVNKLDCCGASSQVLEMSVMEVVSPLWDIMELEAMSPEIMTCLPPTDHITAQTWTRNLRNSVHLG